MEPLVLVPSIDHYDRHYQPLGLGGLASIRVTLPVAGSLNPKDMTPQEFKEALNSCKTEEELDALCQKEVQLLFTSESSKELMKDVYAARYKIIDKRFHP